MREAPGSAAWAVRDYVSVSLAAMLAGSNPILEKPSHSLGREGLALLRGLDSTGLDFIAPISASRDVCVEFSFGSCLAVRRAMLTSSLVWLLASEALAGSGQ